MGKDAVEFAIIVRRDEIEIPIGRIELDRAHERLEINFDAFASVSAEIQEHELQIGLPLVAGDADNDLIDAHILMLDAATFLHSNVVAVYVTTRPIGRGRPGECRVLFTHHLLGVIRRNRGGVDCYGCRHRRGAIE